MFNGMQTIEFYLFGCVKVVNTLTNDNLLYRFGPQKQLAELALNPNSWL